MKHRNALRTELKDGTLEDGFAFLSTKRQALSVASYISKRDQLGTTSRIWVDDTKTDLGVKAFEVSQ